MTPFTCPCCGYLVFEEPTGSYGICPICYWEDDDTQLARFNIGGGANRLSLLEAQGAFEKLGAIEEQFKERARKPEALDEKDPMWRKIDPSRDKELDGSYSQDKTKLYYWRT